MFSKNIKMKKTPAVGPLHFLLLRTLWPPRAGPRPVPAAPTGPGPYGFTHTVDACWKKAVHPNHAASGRRVSRRAVVGGRSTPDTSGCYDRRDG